MAHFPLLYVVRHGETEWNARGKVQGLLNSPLTARGREQAWRVAKTLQRELINKPGVALISSPLGRAQDTAGVIADLLGLTVEIAEPLREIDIGCWSGLTYEDVYSGWREDLFHTTEDDWHFNSPDGERYSDVKARVTGWLQSITRPSIAVCHGISGRLLRGAVLGSTQEQVINLPIPQDVVFRLEAGRETALLP